MLPSVKKGVILAAGLSRRLRPLTGGRSKLIYPINGIPLILYPITNLIVNGVEDICIVANKKNYKYISLIMEKIFDVNYQIVLNTKPSLGNGYSFLLSKKCVDEPFILSMADHIYHPRIIKKLLKSFNELTDIVVGSDSSPKFVSIDEATKIYAKNGEVIRIGKRLKRFTHVDIGVFVVQPTVLDLVEDLDFSEPFGFSDIINMSVRAGLNVVVSDVNGDYWTEVDTPRDVEELLNGKRKVILDRTAAHLKLSSKRIKELSKILEMYMEHQ